MIKEEKYVRCLFAGNRRYDASSKTLADCPYDKIQWQQPSDRLRREQRLQLKKKDGVSNLLM